jgi:uroporphyrinogen decarboxylase
MTSRERTWAVLNRQMPDRLPREFKLTSPLAEQFERRIGTSNVAEYYGMDVRDVFLSSPESMPDFSRYYPEGVPPLLNPAGWEVGEWGVGQVPGSQLHFIHIEHPMKNLSDISELKDFPFPDYTDPKRHAHLEAEVAALHERGLFVIGFMEWTIFEIAWHMRGMDEFFNDLLFNPPFAEYLLEQITERRCFQAKRYAEAGVDLIKIGDDVGTQRAMLMSPSMYREWFKPRYTRVIQAAREISPDLNVCYHSDGNCWDIIPDLIEAGVTVLNPVQPECLDIADVKREFGRDLVFWGGIGTQTTMPFDSAEGVYNSVQRSIDILGPTGYFPCPTHVLEPEVPFENVMAYLKAVEEYTPA